MTSISWPVILSGDYTDGSVCNAADYKNDFYLLRDAVNQLYERFGSYRISAHVKRPFGYTGDTNEYLTIAGHGGGTPNYVATCFHQQGTGVNDLDEAATRTTSTVIKVPTWMQGVRIRGIQVNNTSNIHYNNGSDGAYPAGTHDLDITHIYKPPTFGVSVASTLAGLKRNTTTDVYDNAVDVQQITFGAGTDDNTQLDDLTVRSSGYTDKGEVGGINWSTPAGATQLFQPVFKESTADYVVEPGSYIALWCAGAVRITNNHISTAMSGPYYLEYTWDVLLDAMIPIP